MIQLTRHSLPALAAIAVISVAACGDSATASKPKATVTLSFAGVRPATASAAVVDALASGPSYITVGTDVLIITEAKLVMRQIEMKRSDGTCSSGSENDDCEEFTVGPTLASLPVTAGATGATGGVTINAPAGTYTGVEFEIHKPGGDAADVAFKAANPEFANISIRVRGTFNGVAFEYTSALSEQQNVHFLTPVAAVAGKPLNITVSIDMATWFRVGRTTGALINPASANPGGVNESLVKANIKASIRAFEDNDKDGDERNG